jgi:hypothetical protein
MPLAARPGGQRRQNVSESLASNALRLLVGPLDFSAFELLKFISNLPPLTDEVQVHHTDCVILARKRATLTLHFLLSTVFDPANHLSQQ